MKALRKYTYIIILSIFACCFLSCKKYLVEDVFTQYDPDDLLKDEDGIQKVLIGAYAQLQSVSYNNRDKTFLLGEFPADQMLMNGGGLEAQSIPFMNFQWDASSSIFRGSWAKMYQAIRNANVLLDNVERINSISPEKLKIYKAEAKFIRAAAYLQLFNTFGPPPLILTASKLDLEPQRATDVGFKAFLEGELKESASGLPVIQSLKGKATKGAALALLCKFYLNTKQWQNAADAAKQIIELNQYALFPDIANLFTVANENNKEFIFVYPCVAQEGYGNNVMAHTFPLGYPIQNNWIRFGAQFRLRTSFVKSFDPSDKRKDMILTIYQNTSGKTINLLESPDGIPLDDSRSFKFRPDPNALGENNGNDVPVVRYADILLSRAEALNELYGPNPETINLINEVRQRAGVPTISLSDFSLKDLLRAQLLKERGWEFFSEGLRREDLIRNGTLISGAIARGKSSAVETQMLFPIPQSEIDANPKLKQNPGYQ